MASGNSLVVATPPPEIEPFPITQDNGNLRRTHFPPTFIFGCGTAAFQVEGAASVYGKGPSIWDDLTMNTPGKIADGSNGNVACDMYHRYEEDIVQMKNMGFDSYRFSISWPRILPTGRASGGVNRSAIDYYNKLIDFVLKQDMKPLVTLFHWDTPLVLEREYGGFLRKEIVEDFRDYVELCFWEFGDRVKWWTTLNEPWTYAANGYVDGWFLPQKEEAPAVPSHRKTNNMPGHRHMSIAHMEKKGANKGRTLSELDNYNPKKGPYTVAKHLLLAHAAAVHLYRNKFKEVQQGQIGIVLNSHWHVPYDENNPDDVAAAKRGVDFMLGWFLEPVLYGHYPKSMTDFVPPENLAHFSQQETRMLKGTIDYLGLNYYTTTWAKYDPKPSGVGYPVDMKITYPPKKDDQFIGDAAGSTWQYIVPWGIYEHLVYLKKTYAPDLPPIYISENGVGEQNDHALTAKEACGDTTRLQFHQDHLANILKAMTSEYKVDVRGYFAWSYCDNFEWMQGYTVRFGLVYIDYVNNQTRYPKDSAKWFIKFLKGPKVVKSASKKRQAIEAIEAATGYENENGSGGLKKARAAIAAMEE